MGLTKAQLEALNLSSFPDNTSGLITPEILRDYNSASIANTVNQDTYTTDSASFNSRILAITGSGTTNTGSLVTTASFNAYTQSTNNRLTNIESTTASLLVETQNLELFSASALVSISNLNASSASQQVSINSLNSATSSYVTETESGSFLLTASFDNGTRNLTFTKGNNTTFAVNIPDISGSGTLPSGVISGSAQITSLGFVSSSVTASSLITASASGPTITFTKGDNTQFSVTVATGSFVSASFAATASEARNVVIIARNGNASTLGAGTVVHITGASGDNPIFTTASFNTEALSSNTLGLLRYSSPSGADVEVVVNGVVTGLNTDPALGYAAGDIVYLSSSGQFTRVQPQAPNQIVTLGQVLRAQQNNGSIYVSINNGWELNELHNVQITNPQTGDLIQYESASYGLWKNKSISGAGITTTSSFNAYTSSTNGRLTNIESTTASLLVETQNLELFSASALSSISQLNASSASQQVSINNLNTTTASLLIETQNLELFSASALTSLSNLNTATASLFTSASLSLTTASVSGQTMTFRKGDGTTFNVTLPTGSGGGTIDTGSFATTGSNSFNGSQIITGSMTSSLDIRVAGVKMGFGNPAGTSSIAIGTSTLLNNTGTSNIAIGSQAMQQNTTGRANVAIALDAMSSNTTGRENVAIGEGAFRDNQTGIQNTVVGHNAGLNAGNVNGNTLIGTQAGRSVKNSNNTIVGQTAGLNITSGSGNTIVGQAAGVDIGSGTNNTFIGQNAGRNISGSQNTLIGASVGVGSWNNVIALSDGAGNIRAQFIGNEWDLTGSVDIQNTLTASLAQGFTYVGNASGRTIAVSTSSFASTINTGSFATTGSNAFFGTNTFSGAVSFTGSAPSILSSSFSGSLITNLTDIYTDIPAVQQIVTLTSASYAALVSGSLTNPNTLYIVSGSISGSGGGGTTINTGSFATTGSNTFTDVNYFSQSVEILGSLNMPFGNITMGYPKQMGDPYNYTAIVSTPGVNAISGGGRRLVLQGDVMGSTANRGVTILNGLGITGSVVISPFGGMTPTGGDLDVAGTFTSSLQEGYVWVGNSSGRTATVATSSFGGGGGTINTGSFATTGSNTFNGTQTIQDNQLNILGQFPYVQLASNVEGSGSNFVNIDLKVDSTTYSNTFSGISIADSATGNLIVGMNTNTFSPEFGGEYVGVIAGGGSNVSGSNNAIIFRTGSGDMYVFKPTSFAYDVNITGSLSASLQQGFTYVGDANGRTTLVATSSFGGGGTINTGSFATTGSNTFTGDQTFIDNANNFFTISDASGSMMLVGKGFTSASLHLSASVPATGSFVNLIFKTNNNTGDTIISGSNNIFINPAAPTAGFKRYIGSNNMLLQGPFVPQITGSMQFSPTINGNIGGVYAIRGPISASTMLMNNNISANGNINIGIPGQAVFNAERLTGATSVSNNIVAGTLNLVANQSEIRGTSNVIQNNINGFVQLNISSSGITFNQNTVNDGNFNFTNQYSSGAIGFGAAAAVSNTISGNGNRFIVTGSQTIASPDIPLFNQNLIVGNTNTAFINSDTSRVVGSNIYNSLAATSLLGNRLIVTGSSNLFSDISSYGSTFIGRYNASDGIRDKSSDIIFAVGTGNSGARKTGFLIDSGSNSFFEGTVNISGSLLVNGASPVAISTGSLLVTASFDNGTRNLTFTKGDATTFAVNIPDTSGSTGNFATTGSNTFNGNQTITGSVSIRGNTTFTSVNNDPSNVILGSDAMANSVTSNAISVAIGNSAMKFASGSSQNVAIGNRALFITSGSLNIAIGSETLVENTTGNQNVAIGVNALNLNTVGSNNFALGINALQRNTTGNLNLAIGGESGQNSSGSSNIFIGGQSGKFITGSANTIIGSFTGTAGTVLNNNVVIADGVGNVKAQFSGSAWSFTGGINFESGSNKTTGIVTADGFGVTVTNSLVTPNSMIFLTAQALDSGGNPANFVTVYDKTNGSFKIRSNNQVTTVPVAYLIINPTP